MLKSLFLVLILIMAACSPAPRRQLTQDERTADMKWIYSIFDHNYAPTAHKEKLFKFSYDEVKASFLNRAQKEQSNHDFYMLMLEFIAKFQDAHTSGSLQASPLEGRTKVAYLGFNGTRDGDKFVVTKLLPTISSESNFPIKVGSVITKVNGLSLKENVDQKLTKYRNLGLDEANYTSLMGALFSSTTLTRPLPTEDTIEITIEVEEKEKTITLPWIVKDLPVFQKEQKEALSEKTGHALTESQVNIISSLSFLVQNKFMTLKKVTSLIQHTQDFNSLIEDAYNLMSHVSISDSFELDNFNEIWDSLDIVELIMTKQSISSKSGAEKLLEKERSFNQQFYPFEESTTFPAGVLVYTDSNSKKHRVGYIFINTFSPENSSEIALKEVKAALLYFKDMGITKLVIDTLDNGGGSLELGNKLGQLLSSKRLALPKLEFKVNETWVDNFDKASANASSDAEKELAKRVFQDLEQLMANSTPLSKPYEIDTLYPFQLSGNEDMLKNETEEFKFKTVLLINEMCASMCDIFAAILKDNKLATVMGTQSMGAGGNVTTHSQAPNSKLIVRQTESLVVRTNGEYLENQGVKPDKEIKTFEHRDTKFADVIDTALAELTKK